MLNNLFIKATNVNSTPLNQVPIFLLLALILLTTACSNQPIQNDQNTAESDLKNIGKSIIAMVDEPKQNEGNSTGEVTTVKAPTVVHNLYLEQQKTAMSGIPLFTIEEYKKALSAIDKKQWQQASKLLDKIITTQPQLSGVYYNKAVIAKAQHKNSMALAEVNRAITANELNLYAHHLKGQLLRLNGDFSGAEQSYLTALAIWPNYGDVLVNMAVLLELYRGRLLDAHHYYSAYLTLKPDDKQVKRYLAGLEIKIKRAGLLLPADAINTQVETITVLEKG